MVRCTEIGDRTLKMIATTTMRVCHFIPSI
jgi:hypothetical protein